MEPPRQLETLDDLVMQAEHYADYSMRHSGRVTPALFLIGAEGPAMFLPENFADEDAKDDFAQTARLVCIAHAAIACCMVLESWMTCAKAGEPLDVTEPPSEAFDRREVVVVMGEARGAQKQKLLPIIRSDNGKFFGFGEPDLPDLGKMEGRFVQILLPAAPNSEMRLLAQTMLKVKGVTPAKSRNHPCLPCG
ncbi:MAG: hypothetical protein ABSE16_03990 [Verrucomicrobiota bacterium]